MSRETIARRYSAALADVVLKSGETETVKSELAGWTDLFRESENLQTVFGNPAIPQVGKEKVLEGLIAKVNPSRATANFLRVLLKNSRLTEIGEINERFDSVLQERGGVVAAEITSARDLPEHERNEFKTNLERLTGKQVNVSFSTDKDIIGGVVTRIGSTVYDSSVRTKLENLKEQLVNG